MSAPLSGAEHTQTPVGEPQAPGARYRQGHLVLTAGAGNPPCDPEPRRRLPGLLCSSGQLRGSPLTGGEEPKRHCGGLCTWRARSQSWVLDSGVHHVADNPAASLGSAARGCRSDPGGDPGLLPLLSHTFPFDDLILGMAPITIHLPGVCIRLDCVWGSPRHVSLAGPPEPPHALHQVCFPRSALYPSP